MKPEELRIGNWVNYKGVEVKWSIEDFSEWGKNIELLIKPIPLTEEWLERFGVNKTETYYEVEATHPREKLQIVKAWDNFFYFCMPDGVNVWGPKLEYVHHLQNLYYALTNKELTLK